MAHDARSATEMAPQGLGRVAGPWLYLPADSQSESRFPPCPTNSVKEQAEHSNVCCLGPANVQQFQQGSYRRALGETTRL